MGILLIRKSNFNANMGRGMPPSPSSVLENFLALLQLFTLEIPRYFTALFHFIVKDPDASRHYFSAVHKFSAMFQTFN